MIIGNGMLARAFEIYRDEPDITIFASGVSNSQETRPEVFQKERGLLLSNLATFRGKHFVYFGSCGVANDPEMLSAYLRHKLEMEKLVISHTDGIVFRLPQVVGPTGNPNTLTNFLRDRILLGERFQLWTEAERNLIDIDDITRIVAGFLDDKSTLSGKAYDIAAQKSLRSIEIVRILERVLGVNAQYDAIRKGDPLDIDSSDALRIARTCGVDLGDGYAERIIRKYYAPSSA